WTVLSDRQRLRILTEPLKKEQEIQLFRQLTLIKCKHNRLSHNCVYSIPYIQTTIKVQISGRQDKTRIKIAERKIKERRPCYKLISLSVLENTVPVHLVQGSSRFLVPPNISFYFYVKAARGQVL
ncbi:MAG: hypothetical protein M3Y53_08060, partial [Thermoproteota archaeon]|nr:hypothetical protein [Thermoproteota archaeon]